MSVIRVFIVEDDPRPRAALRALLDGTPGFGCCGECGSGEAALRLIPTAQPDVILMDIGLPRIDGIACAHQLKSRSVPARIVMLTQLDDPKLVFQALAAGASGYLMKYEPLARILEALEQVHRGGGMMSPAVARLVMESFERGRTEAAPEAPLSAREREILELMRREAITASKDLAARLRISDRTVDGHLASIYDKLHVHSRAAALARYVSQRS
jgi:DNA-binding NarL/FixJ family response regulator